MHWEVSIVAHTGQYSDEDKNMRITCYVICAVSIAFCIGLFLYATFA